MSPLAPAVIVFERRPCWESELKRRLPVAETLVRPCRSAADTQHLACAMPGSVVVVDLAVGAEAGLPLLERLLVDRTPVAIIVIAAESHRDLEWPARELGASAFLAADVSGDELAGLCRRLLGVPPCRAPEPALR